MRINGNLIFSCAALMTICDLKILIKFDIECTYFVVKPGCKKAYFRLRNLYFIVMMVRRKWMDVTRYKRFQVYSRASQKHCSSTANRKYVIIKSTGFDKQFRISMLKGTQSWIRLIVESTYRTVFFHIEELCQKC